MLRDVAALFNSDSHLASPNSLGNKKLKGGGVLASLPPYNLTIL